MRGLLLAHDARRYAVLFFCASTRSTFLYLADGELPSTFIGFDSSHDFLVAIYRSNRCVRSFKSENVKFREFKKLLILKLTNCNVFVYSITNS